MKKTLILFSALIAAGIALAAYPARQNNSTVNMDKVTGNWDSFRWNWSGAEDQDVTFTVTSGTTSTGTALSAGCAFKAARQTSTGQVAYVVKTTAASQVTVSGSNATFSVARTNIPPNGTYQCELWGWSGAATNVARTYAQGTLVVFNSLYGVNDSTFPYPTATNMSDYVPFTDTGYIAAVALTTTNAIPKSGVLNSTNGVYWTRSTNNYWILFP